MEELIKDHFHFFREYCEHKKSHTSHGSQSSNQPTYSVSARVSISAIGKSPFLARVRSGLFMYKHWLVRKPWKIILNIYYFTSEELYILLDHKGKDTYKHEMFPIFNYTYYKTGRPLGSKFLLQIKKKKKKRFPLRQNQCLVWFPSFFFTKFVQALFIPCLTSMNTPACRTKKHYYVTLKNSKLY